MRPGYWRISANSFAIDESDPVLVTALESGELAAVNATTGVALDQDQLLAAIPLSDSTGDIHAMLLVRSMPFFAFHENNLKLIAVLVAHGVDHLRFGTAVSSVARFIAAFERVHQDYRAFKLDATLLRLSGTTADVMAAYEKLRSSVRAIDLICIAHDKGEPVVWILLPLDRYRKRTHVDATGGERPRRYDNCDNYDEPAVGHQ